MLDNPSQESNNESQGRERNLWNLGFMTGVASWVGVIALLKQFSPQQVGPGIRALLVNPLALVIEIDNQTFLWALASGVLLHAAFWTALFIIWRQRSREG